MSQVFEGYERQYCELSANLSKKCTSATLLDGEQKKQKISEVKNGMEDAEALIRKMDLEARSLPPNAKAMLLAKLREYKSDLNNLKTEVKRITSDNANQASRDELLESGMADAKMESFQLKLYPRVIEYSAGMADAKMVSADQRQRLMMSTERLNQSSDRIREGRKVMLETEELGVSILQDLHQQPNITEVFSSSTLKCKDNIKRRLVSDSQLHGVDDNISRSKKILTTMSRRMNRNKWIIGSIIAVLMEDGARATDIAGIEISSGSKKVQPLEPTLSVAVEDTCEGETFPIIRLEEGVFGFKPAPSREAFPLLQLLDVLLGETQVFSGELSRRLDSCRHTLVKTAKLGGDGGGITVEEIVDFVGDIGESRGRSDGVFGNAIAANRERGDEGGISGSDQGGVAFQLDELPGANQYPSELQEREALPGSGRDRRLHVEEGYLRRVLYRHHYSKLQKKT
nr:vesicle transport V-SNARE 13-like [Ipomoea batatas]